MTMMNKVPQVTIYFWIIKVLATTVGETIADFLSVKLGLGLVPTSFIMAAVFLIALFFQMRTTHYVRGIYWAVVVFISVMGTLITDNLTDNFGVSLEITTPVFAVILALVFAAWWSSEHSLSVHDIKTTKREAFYWLTILFTFALGTAAGDLISEKLQLGYPLAVVLFVSAIALITALYYVFKINGVLAFWLAYILTRPLGASIGDLLSQPFKDGGLGLGTTITSAAFLAAIVGIVLYLGQRESNHPRLSQA